MRWPEIVQVHSQAAAEFAAAAERVAPERWLHPRAEGKWTPAEVVEHVTLAYEILLRELEGGAGMKVRTKLWQRLLLRVSMVPKILRGGAFPADARAPREIRPTVSNPDRGAALARFREKAARFQSLAADAVDRKRRVRLTHAYFGTAPLPDAVLLCARHVEHHHKQLVQVADR